MYGLVGGHRRFTLVELMIALAIFSILTAIAVPQMYFMSMRAKRAEIGTNVRSIAVAEVAYHAAMDKYVAHSGAGVYHPVWPPPGKKAVAWTTSPEFDILGYRPDGKVRGSYQMADWLVPQLLISGFSNIDEQGAYYGYQWEVAPVQLLYYENKDQF